MAYKNFRRPTDAPHATGTSGNFLPSTVWLGTLSQRSKAVAYTMLKSTLYLMSPLYRSVRLGYLPYKPGFTPPPSMNSGAAAP